MRLSNRKSFAGFTLIELLAVIAILGILAALLFPTVAAQLDRAKRAADGASVREVLKAASIYAQDNGDKLPDPQTITTTQLAGGTALYRWPGILAKNNILVDPTVYLSKQDPLYPATVPSVILRAGVAARNTLDTTFIATTLALELVGGVKTSDPSTTPVLYTRGLQTAGTWNGTTGSSTIGVYKDIGGYIGFLGSNVNFYSNTGTAPNGIFTSNGTGASKPVNVLQAIPLGTSTANRARIYGTNAAIGTSGGTLATQGP
jgi:prepilin-type N-terminal cleavage/methylation domain-containing protein